MRYFWDKTPDMLPRPELNPLSNPALERNLSRWAQIYFSNPPGKREQAISRLLQEIKSETSEILVAEQARRKASATSTETASTQIRSTETQNISCSACQRRNPPGHRFCGQCGAALNGGESTSGNGSAFAADQTPEASTAQPDSEVRWLRDRALGSLYESEAPSRQGWKYVLCGSMIALAGLAYLQWKPGHLTRVASPAATATAKMTTPALALPSEKSSSAAVQRDDEANASVPPASSPEPTEVQSALAAPKAQVVQDASAMPSGIQAAAQKSSLLGPTPTHKAVEGGDRGSSDLQLAQRYLEGSTGSRDSSEAAKLLWKAVRKQNTAAAVLLSELYARGDGVPRSCDQARLLLMAASRRGAPQAAEQLRDLESRGCQ